MPPISRATFRAGKLTSDPTQPIIKFLKDHPDEAFSLSEVLSGVVREAGTSFVLDVVTMMTIKERLDQLVASKLVARGVVAGQEYFAIPEK